MMADYIDRNRLHLYLADLELSAQCHDISFGESHEAIDTVTAADVVEVVRCKDCIYYHKSHVRCNDGTEKDISEFPQEAFGTLGKYVTGEYGINVGGKCEIDKNKGYAVDKSVFKEPNDFCSYGVRRNSDGC